MFFSNKFKLQIKKFNIDELKNIKFGNVEGEDDDLLKEAFYSTSSINKIHPSNQINYIMGPKGCGKSALFTAFEKNYKDLKENIDFENSIIIPIKDAFCFNSTYLDTEKFINYNSTKCSIFWALYIIKKIISSILSESNTALELTKFKGMISKYKELQIEYDLYNITDYLKEFKLTLAFNINGQQLSFSPQINFPKEKKNEININSVFKIINECLNLNNKMLYIFIDRIDDFVRNESYDIQKNYIQGLYDCVEEIRKCNKIQPVIFLRTDLFYNLNISIGYDKVEPRTLVLKWGAEELYEFILLRLLSNSYISDNFFSYLFSKLYENNKRLKRFSHRIFMLRNKMANKSANILWYKNEPSLTNIAKPFIQSFFPQNIKHLDGKNKSSSISFYDWVFSHFQDHNSFINLRFLIVFFNKLFENQYKYYIERNYILDENDVGKITYDKNNILVNIFSLETIQETYTEVQDYAIKSIFSLLMHDNWKKYFVQIHNNILKNKSISISNIKSSEYKINPDDYNSLLKYLRILGYLNSDENGLINIPIIYKTKLNIN